MDIGVLITTIPPRKELLARALDSVNAQTLQPAQIHVELDSEHAGAAVTKTRGLESITTEWVAFLDDDDYYLPTHLESMAEVAKADEHDVIYTGPLVLDPAGNKIPLMKEWGNFGQEFDEAYFRSQSFIGMFSLVRTELARQVGGFHQPNPSIYDDWDFYLAMLNAGARFKHLPIQTYVWNHTPNTGNTGLGNTSGKPDRWT